MTPDQTLTAIETLSLYGIWTENEVRGSQDSSGLTADRVYMSIRGGGIGASAWVAHIPDIDMRWGLKRVFVDDDQGPTDGKPQKSGGRTWTLELDGIYEVRGLCIGSKRSEDGFFLRRGEEVAWIGEARTEVIQAIKTAKKAPVLAAEAA
ncbi:hypothetical protein [Arthrobacter sp. STN4]|uniref:hypothetical protein n=1 Tax=Arthrobacter sp. STN4 TaxID=2923276 RepID=UPI00211A5B41|nr:hypothetical protein [Arthrobacter sp. STN4]MCQ9162982.1 hypothetical protein [Arthrobacter sp. STN4]